MFKLRLPELSLFQLAMLLLVLTIGFWVVTIVLLLVSWQVAVGFITGWTFGAVFVGICTTFFIRNKEGR